MTLFVPKDEIERRQQRGGSEIVIEQQRRKREKHRAESERDGGEQRGQGLATGKDFRHAEEQNDANRGRKPYAECGGKPGVESDGPPAVEVAPDRAFDPREHEVRRQRGERRSGRFVRMKMPEHEAYVTGARKEIQR